MNIKIFTVTCLLTLGLYNAARAQETNGEPVYPRHEVTIGLGGGLSTLNYKIENGTHTNGFGGQAGLGYMFFFSKHWGLGTGIDINLFTAKSKLDNGVGGSYNATVINGLLPNDNFVFNYNLSNYEEKQKAWYLSIPLMLQFQTAGKNKFFIAAGGKIAFPVSSTYKADSYTMQTNGVFPDGRTYDDLPQYGFGQFDKSSDGDLDLDLAYFASLEAGVKWQLCKKNSLYTGIYLDYGLNNVYKKSEKEFVEYTGNMDVVTNSSVQSKINGVESVDKMTPLALGIKIKYAFGLGEIKKKAKPQEEQPKVTEQKPTEPVDNGAAEKARQEEAARQKALADEAAKKAEADRLAAQQEAARKAKADSLAQQEAAKKTQPEKTTKPQQSASDIAIIEEPIEDYNLAQISPEEYQKKKLDEKIVLLKKYPETKFYIYGHTCDLGGDEVNERVGLRRAEKAKAYLISKGIDSKRIIGMASKRDTEPVVPNTSEENRKKNRRVQLVIKK